MARITETKVPAFVPVDDSTEILTDPTNRRVVQLFDALRKRGVGPERASYVVAQVHQNSAGGGGHPAAK